MAKVHFLGRNLMPQNTLHCLDLSSAKVMGIVNLTPDSFYDGGTHNNLSRALKKCAQMLAEGASILDIGACSSRPGAEYISEEEEKKRLLPILKGIVRAFPEALLSIDTFRASIAEAAIQAGAHLINDISAGTLDPNMFATMARLKVPYSVMHMKDKAETMSKYAHDENLVDEVHTYFIEKIKKLQSLGLQDILIDPGFGFSKTMEQNYQLLNGMELLQTLGMPILVGLSRKSMIYKALNNSPGEALNGTTAANMIALMRGANILRVHDVKPAMETIQIFNKLHGPNSLD